MSNPFFKNKGPKKIEEILNQIKFKNKFEYSGINITDIKDLVNASNKDITFFHSKKYELAASKTKAAFCITTKNLSNKLPDTCKPIEVENVLVSTAMITTMFYPDAITDDFDTVFDSIGFAVFAFDLVFAFDSIDFAVFAFDFDVI